MKLNKIWMVLAATAIVGCTSDDLNELTSKQAPEDSRLIELNENFVLSGVGVEGVATRTHWEQDAETKALVNKFLPIYTTAPDGSSTLDQLVEGEGLEAVGLCWLGQAPGAEVYTNYEFYHFGWLKKGETEADLDNCVPVKLYNGALYDEITPSTGAAIGDEADESDFTISSPKTSWELNYNSGVYKTDNKTIFGGKYIVYYPYNPEFQETGTIPAIAKTSFDWDPTIVTDAHEVPELGKATFRYSAPVEIDGGMNAANFGLYNLSTLVRLRVFTSTAGDPYNADNIDQVVLYSPSGKFVKQANLGADKIAAGKQGQELYAETEGTKTITTKFTSNTSLNVKNSTTVNAYITVLPTTVDDLVALVHNADEGFWYRVELPATEFKAGNAQVINITVKESDITSDFIAVDDASLRAALLEAEGEATESNPVTITLIGDVTLTNTPSDLNIDEDEDRYITIDGGDIIVPQGVTLTLTTLKEMKSTVRVLGKDCCTTGVNGGRLVVTGTDADLDATILHNITLEETEARIDPTVATSYDDLNPQVTYQGSAKITIADDAKVTVEAGNVNVDREVLHKGAIEIGDNKDKDDVLLGAKVNVSATGSLKFMGEKSTVVNNGIIEVAKSGQFNLTDANNNSTYREGARMTNNGKFIHNVDAGVGTAVQYMQQNGEYRCKVDGQVKLNNAYKQWTACNVIEIIAAGDYDLGTASEIATDATAKTAPYKHGNDYIDIEITNGAVVFTNPAKDKKDIQIGNLTVTDAGTLDITYAAENDAEKQRTLTVNGDMAVNANATISSSRKISVTENILVKDATLKYVGGRYASDPTKPTVNKALAVTKNIEVSGSTAKFDASDGDALNITCANFYLADKASAEFGNQTNGGDKTMTVSGTIKNPKDCTFDIKPASTGVIAWITCTELVSGGTYNASEPLVVAPAE